MKAGNRVILNYVVICLVCTIATAIVLFLEHKGAVAGTRNTLVLSEWTVTARGTTTENANPSQLAFPSAKRGDRFAVQGTVPETDMQFPVLCSFSKYCAVIATSGGKEIYSAGVSEYESNKIVGCWINQIPLRDLSPERDITITYIVAENNVVSSLPDHIVIPASEVYSAFLKKGQVSFAVCVFLMFVGLIGTLIASTSFVLKERIHALIAISLFAFSAGLLVFCSNGYILIVSHNYTLNAWLMYLSLFFCPLSLGWVFKLQISSTQFDKIALRIFFIAFLSYFAVAVTLQVATPIHFLTTIPVWDVLVLVSLCVSFYASVRHLMAQKTKTPVVTVGFILLIVFCLVDFARTLVYMHGAGHSHASGSSFISMGVLVFVVSSLLTYISWLADFTRNTAEEAIWQRMVDYDAVSGLPSKSKTMQMLRQFYDNGDEYAVVAFTLRNLDEVKGEMGDVTANDAIARYAKLIKKVFGSYGFCGRIGKNSFVVAAPEISENKLRELEFVFSTYAKREKSHNEQIMLDSSVGYAFSRDCGNQEPLAICQLAEEHAQDVLLLAQHTEVTMPLLSDRK